MKFVAMVVLPAVCLLASVGCGSSSSDGDDSNDGDAIDWSQVSPPPNIDITSCYSLRYEDDMKLDACSACCETAGFMSASYQNDDHCTCGTNPPDDRDTVCAAPTPGEPSGEMCRACCDAAGYNGSIGFTGMTGGCTCFGRTDTAVCAASLAHESPDEACSYCCLENGFLSNYFVGIGDMECGCIAP